MPLFLRSNRCRKPSNGLTGLSAVLMALVGRAQTGKGDYIDCAMFDALLPWCAHVAGSAIAGGPSPKSASQRSLGGAAFYQIYKTADEKHIVLGGRELNVSSDIDLIFILLVIKFKTAFMYITGPSKIKYL